MKSATEVVLHELIEIRSTSSGSASPQQSYSAAQGTVSQEKAALLARRDSASARIDSALARLSASACEGNAPRASEATPRRASVPPPADEAIVGELEAWVRQERHAMRTREEEARAALLRLQQRVEELELDRGISEQASTASSRQLSAQRTPASAPLQAPATPPPVGL
jgi:hypothetical protein